MLLQGKGAVVYGGGAVGGAAAKSFAHEAVAAFVASDRAATMAGIVMNVSSGVLVN